MPCDEYRNLVRTLGEGELPPEQQRLLDDHLPSCESCRKAVLLLRLDDVAVRDALLGFPGASAADRRASRRLVRFGVLTALAIGSVLLLLWLLYQNFEGQARAAREKRQGAATLERLVLPRSIDRPLPVVVSDLELQADAPIEVVSRDAPMITLDLERRIRLRSALALLAEFHRISFRVGEDRVPFPSPDAPPERADATGDFRLSLAKIRVTLNYDGNDLRGALEQLKAVKGINLVVAPSAREIVAAAKVRLDVREAPLEEVLSDLLSGAGLEWEARHEVLIIQ